jgi:hypothetical protein
MNITIMQSENVLLKAVTSLCWEGWPPLLEFIPESTTGVDHAFVTVPSVYVYYYTLKTILFNLSRFLLLWSY